MTTNHIEITGQESRLAAEVRRLIDRTDDLQNEMKRMKLVMDEAGASSADWVAVETAFGFKSGTAVTIYDLLNKAQVKINSADIDNFVNRLG